MSHRSLLSAGIILAWALLSLARTSGAGGWTLTGAPDAVWKAVACSADGQKLAATDDSSNRIYTSKDFGQTWRLSFILATPLFFSDIASSADGSTIVVGTGSLQYDGGPIFLSPDSGVSWTPARGVPFRNWQSVAASADGDTLLAGGDQGLYLSTDSGVTWVSNMVPQQAYTCVGSSADGTKLFGVSEGSGLIYASTNSGATWLAHSTPGSGGLYQVVLSADGRRLVGLGSYYTNKLYTSTDFGVTWRANDLPTSPGLARLGSSADGNVLVYAVAQAAQTGAIYLSTDAGAHWLDTDAPVTNWWALAASADGHRLMAAPWVGGIYAYYSPPTPTLDIGVSGGNLLLSWLVPSTNFVLQQVTGLENPNWEAVTNALALNVTNLHYEITAPAANRKEFYRLATP